MKDPSLSDTRILAVAIDSKEDLQKMSDNISKNGGQPQGFLFLSDSQHKVIDRYGLLKERSQGLPHPATYVIDKKGVVRWKFVDVNYRVRPAGQQILAALKALR